MSKISNERLADIRATVGQKMMVIPVETGFAIIDELQSLRSQPAGVRVAWLTDAFGAWLAANATPAQIDSYNAYYQRVIAPEVNALEPQQEEAVAWQNGEREIAQRWIAKLMAKLSTKPDHADDLLWLDRINGLLFHPTPAQKVQESQTVSEEMVTRAHAAYAKTCGGLLEGNPMRNALTAALESPHVTE